MHAINKMLILCGGRGKRMEGSSSNLPKALQKISSLSILEHKIHYYYNQGIKNIVLAIGYKGEIIKDIISNTEFPLDLNIEYSDAGVRAGILKRISVASKLFNESMLVTYGDTFTNIIFKDLLDIHHNSDNDTTIVTAPFQNPFGLIEFDSDYKVTMLHTASKSDPLL